MGQLKVNTDSRAKDLLKSYPSTPQKKLLALRKILIEAAQEIEGLDDLEETLRWGELSYIAKHGSTIRIDWKEKNPMQYAIYFKCTSQLIPTFKDIFGTSFKYEGRRAIVFGMNERIPKLKLKKCIKSALQYHKVKHLPDLGLKL